MQRLLALGAVVLVASSPSVIGEETQLRATGIKLLPADGSAADYFGGAVSVFGDTAFVGAMLDDEAGADAGAVYVFERARGAGDDRDRGGGEAVAGGWVELAKLTASDAAPGDFFGRSVAVFGDTAFVGAIMHGARGVEGVREGAGGVTRAAAGVTPAGAVYVFERARGTEDGRDRVAGESAAGEWVEVAKLTASDAEAQDFFGYGVSVSGGSAGGEAGSVAPGSAQTVIVGAYGDDDRGDTSGSAYVFEKVDGTWVEVAKLNASDAAAYARFGAAVSIYGGTILVGAQGDDGAGDDAGAVYVFERVAGEWVEVAKLTASDVTDGVLFGVSVSASGDTVVAGARGEGESGEEAPAEEEPEEEGGQEQEEDFDDAGAVYVFERVAGEWVEVAKLTASDRAAGDLFGFAVSVSGDTVLIGANRDDDNRDDDNRNDSGSAYVFQKAGGEWNQVAKLTTPEAAAAQAGDLFGISVSLFGETVLIGAHAADDNGVNSGSVWVFDLRGRRPR